MPNQEFKDPNPVDLDEICSTCGKSVAGIKKGSPFSQSLLGKMTLVAICSTAVNSSSRAEDIVEKPNGKTSGLQHNSRALYLGEHGR